MLPQFTKTCTGCHQELPASPEFFSKHTKGKDGLASWCKTCHHDWYIAHREQHQAAVKRWHEAHPERTRELSRLFRERHLEEERDRHRRERAKNPEKHREKVRRSYLKHHEKRLESARKYRAEHIEELRKKDREYQRAHPEKVRARVDLRRARIRATSNGPIDYAAIIQRDGYRCHICGQDVLPESVNFDHVVPLAKGGTHTIENLAVAHLICNIKKNDRLLPQKTIPTSSA